MFCMDDLVPQDHLLRLIDQAIDWSFIYDLQPPRLEVAFLHVSAYALDFYILLCYYFND